MAEDLDHESDAQKHALMEKYLNSGYGACWLKDEGHLANAIKYIHNNPVKAGLVERAEEWPFSSAKWFG
jgi:REP element-mobilizing transposase RayT